MASAFDILIAVLIVNLWNDSYTDKWIATAGVTLAIWGIEIALLLKQTIFKIGSYYLWRKRAGIKAIRYQAKKYRLPLPDDHDLEFRYVSGVDYLKSILSDERLTPEARLFVGASIGELGLVGMYSMIDSLQSHAVVDQALGDHFDFMVSVQERVRYSE